LEGELVNGLNNLRKGFASPALVFPGLHQRETINMAVYPGTLE
jgi:hypothetical protein